MYEVIWSKKARGQYRRLMGSDKKRFKKMVEVLEKSPYYYGKSIKRLRGEFEGLHRYRVGDLRVFYAIDETAKRVFVVTIQSRGGAY
jgi:mRNA interferase RelE/StbE